MEVVTETQEISEIGATMKEEEMTELLEDTETVAEKGTIVVTIQGADHPIVQGITDVITQIARLHATGRFTVLVTTVLLVVMIVMTAHHTIICEKHELNEELILQNVLDQKLKTPAKTSPNLYRFYLSVERDHQCLSLICNEGLIN